MDEANERIERTEVMITTIDNPYDYFTQFSQWLLFDNLQGYNTCGYLDRIITQLGGITDDMTQKEEDELVSRAIDEIFTYNPVNMYKRVFRTVQE